VPARGSRTIDVISPHTKRVVAAVPEADHKEIDDAVLAAQRALEFGPWSSSSAVQQSAKDRADILRAISSAIKERANEFASTATLEMGSPINFALVASMPLTSNDCGTHKYPTWYL
jgi:acyl-CoA reductase-like NAD-dependent aldehyde dehydrogenase